MGILATTPSLEWTWRQASGAGRARRSCGARREASVAQTNRRQMGYHVNCRLMMVISNQVGKQSAINNHQSAILPPATYPRSAYSVKSRTSASTKAS